MHLWAVVALAIVVAEISAGPLSSEQQLQCARTCIDNGKFLYEVGKSYIYDYEAETATLSQDSAGSSKYLIKAKAEIESISKCNFVLRLKDISLDHGFMSLEEGRQRPEEVKSILERYVLAFSFQDGKVDHLCSDPNDPTWAVNMKRGVLTAFQNTMENWNNEHNGHEIDVTGKCPVSYKVSSRSAEEIIITKVKEVDNCKERHGIASSVQTTSSNVESLPLLKGTHGCQHKIKDGILYESSCQESFELRPFVTQGKSATASAKLSLVLQSQLPGSGYDKGVQLQRSALTYEHSSNVETNFGIQDTKLALGELCRATQLDVRPTVPRLFSQFVNKLQDLDYNEITEVYASLQLICTNSSNAKKYFFDAASMTGSPAAISLMNRLIETKAISHLEAEMWLLSLALIPKPNEDIIRVAMGLLDNREITGKALLGISSLGYSYCKMNPECRETPVIQKLSQKIRNFIGKIDPKYPIPAEKIDMVVLAFRAVGNLGLPEPLVITILESIKSTENVEIIIAAIESLRRLQCEDMPSELLLGLFSDLNVDTEVRIAAYLSLMKCPTSNIFSAIKSALEIEEVNQVGSFVWTHLSNIQESIDPWKKDVQLIIGDDTLFNKFTSDFRKFSRNYETSFYSEPLRTGTHIEGNVIFSPKSYLPRSGMLDLNVDVFGNRIDLLQIGARIEGFEYIVESFFGPNGYFPEDTIKEVLKSAREKKPYDEKKLKNITDTFNTLNPQDDPRGSLYLRVFDNDLHSIRFNGLRDIYEQSGSPTLLDMMFKLLNSEEVDLMKTITFLDSSITVPTTTGLPLKLKVNGTASINFKMGASVKYVDETFRVKGHFKPSAAVEITGSMTVDGLTSESGVVMVATGHTSTAVEGDFQMKRGQLISGRINFPREKLEILDVQTNFYSIGNGIVAQRKDADGDIKMKSCTGENVAKYMGVQLCGEMKYPPKSGSELSPANYISDPMAIKVYVLKTDPTLTSYEFEYKWQEYNDESGRNRGPIGKIGVISFNTPNSAIDRELTASFKWNYANNSLEAVVNTPVKKMTFNGQYFNTGEKKGFQSSMKINGHEIFNIISHLEEEKNENYSRLMPRFRLQTNDKTLVDASGLFEFGKQKLKVDIGIYHLTASPITLKGSLERIETVDTRRYDIDFELKTPVLSTTTKGFYQLIGSSVSTKVTLDYWVFRRAPGTIEFNAKLIDSSLNRLDKISVSAELKCSAIPAANWAINWDMQKTKGYMSNAIDLAHGLDQKLSLKQQHRFEGEWPFPKKASGTVEVKYPTYGMDCKMDYNHVSNDIQLESGIILKYTPGGEIEINGKLFNEKDGQLMDRGVLIGAKYPNVEIKFEAKIQQPSPRDYTGDAKLQLWDGMWMQGSFASNDTKPPGNAFGRNVQAKVISHRGEPIAVSGDITSDPQNSAINGELALGKNKYTTKLEQRKDRGARHITAVINTPEASHRGSISLQKDDKMTGANVDVRYGDIYHVKADGFVKNDVQQRQGHVEIILDAKHNPQEKIAVDYKVNNPTNETTEATITVEYPKWPQLLIKYDSLSNSINTMKHIAIMVDSKRLIDALVKLESTSTEANKHLEGVLQFDAPFLGISPKFEFAHSKESENFKCNLSLSNRNKDLLSIETSGSNFLYDEENNLQGDTYVTSPYLGREPFRVHFKKISTLNEMRMAVNIKTTSGKMFLVNVGRKTSNNAKERSFEGNLNVSTPFDLIKDISTHVKLNIRDKLSLETEFAWNTFKARTEIDGELSVKKGEWDAKLNCNLSTSLPGLEKAKLSWHIFLRPSNILTTLEVMWSQNKNLTLEVAVTPTENARFIQGNSFIASVHLLSPWKILEDVSLSVLINNVDRESRYSIDATWDAGKVINFTVIRKYSRGKVDGLISWQSPFASLRHGEVNSSIELYDAQLKIQVGVQYNSHRAGFHVDINHFPPSGIKVTTIFTSTIPYLKNIGAELHIQPGRNDYIFNVAIDVNGIRSNAGYQMSFNKHGGFDTIVQVNSPLSKQLNNAKFVLNHNRTEENFLLKSYVTRSDKTLMSFNANVEVVDGNYGKEIQANMDLKSPYGIIEPVRMDLKIYFLSGAYHLKGSLEYKPGKRIEVQSKLKILVLAADWNLLVRTPFTPRGTVVQLEVQYDLSETTKRGDVTIQWDEQKPIQLVVSGRSATTQGDFNVTITTPFQGFQLVHGKLAFDFNNSGRNILHMVLGKENQTVELLVSSKNAKGSGDYNFSFKSPVSGLNDVKMSGEYNVNDRDKSVSATVKTDQIDMDIIGVVKLAPGTMDGVVTIKTTAKDVERMTVMVRYDIGKPEKMASLSVLVNDEEVGLTIQGQLSSTNGRIVTHSKWPNAGHAILVTSYNFGLDTKVLEGDFETEGFKCSMKCELSQLQNAGGFKISYTSTLEEFREMLAQLDYTNAKQRKSIYAVVQKDHFRIAARAEVTDDSVNKIAVLWFESPLSPFEGLGASSINITHRLGFTTVRATANENVIEGVLSYKIAPFNPRKMTTWKEGNVDFTLTVNRDQFILKCTGLKTRDKREINFSVVTPWQNIGEISSKVSVENIAGGYKALLNVQNNEDVHQIEGQFSMNGYDFNIKTIAEFTGSKWNGSYALYFTTKVLDSYNSWIGNMTVLRNELKEEIIIRRISQNQLHLNIDSDSLGVRGYSRFIVVRTNFSQEVKVNSQYNANTARFSYKRTLEGVQVLITGNSVFPEYRTFTLQADFTKRGDKYDVRLTATKNTEKYFTSGTLYLREDGFESNIKARTPTTGQHSLRLYSAVSSDKIGRNVLIEYITNDGVITAKGSLFGRPDKEAFELNVIGTQFGNVTLAGSRNLTRDVAAASFMVKLNNQPIFSINSKFDTANYKMELNILNNLVFEYSEKYKLKLSFADVWKMNAQVETNGKVMAKFDISAKFTTLQGNFDGMLHFNERSISAKGAYELASSFPQISVNITKDTSDILQLLLTGTEHSGIFSLNIGPDVSYEAKFQVTPDNAEATIKLFNPYSKLKTVWIETVIQFGEGDLNIKSNIDLNGYIISTVTSEIDWQNLQFHAKMTSNIIGLQSVEITSKLEISEESSDLLLAFTYLGKETSFKAALNQLDNEVKAFVKFESDFKNVVSLGANGYVIFGKELKAQLSAYVKEETKIEFVFNYNPDPNGEVKVVLKTPFRFIEEFSFILTRAVVQTNRTGLIEAKWNEKSMKVDWYADVRASSVMSKMDITLPYMKKSIFNIVVQYNATNPISKRAAILIEIVGHKVELHGNLDITEESGAILSFKVTTPFPGFENITLGYHHDANEPASPFELNVVINENELLRVNGTFTYNSPFAFKGSLSAKSPIFSIENIGVEYEFEKTTTVPYSGFAELSWSNDQKIQFKGDASRSSINLELKTPLEAVKNLAVTGRLENKDGFTLNSSTSINGQVFSFQGQLENLFPKFFKFNLEVATPFSDYSEFKLSAQLNKISDGMEGKMLISAPFLFASDLEVTLNLRKTNNGTIGRLNLPFGNYQVSVSYNREGDRISGKITVDTPHKSFSSISVSGFIQHDGRYKKKFEIAFDTTSSKHSISGDINVDANIKELIVIFKSSAVANSPVRFHGQIISNSRNYEFDVSISSPSTARRIYGKYGQEGEYFKVGEVNVEFKNPLHKDKYFSLLSNFRLDKQEFEGALTISFSGAPPSSISVRAQKIGNGFDIQVDQTNILPRNLQSVAIRGKFVQNTIQISFITPHKTYTIMADYKVLPRGFQGKLAVDPPIFKIRTLSADWTIVKERFSFSFDGNLAFETDKERNTFSAKASFNGENKLEIYIQSPSIGINTFSLNGLYACGINQCNSSAVIKTESFEHSAELKFSQKGGRFHGNFKSSPLYQTKPTEVLISYVNDGTKLNAEVVLGTVLKVVAEVHTVKDGHRAIISLDTPWLPGGTLEVYENFSMENGKTFSCKIGIKNDKFKYDADLVISNDNRKWVGSLSLYSSSMLRLKIFGTVSCFHPGNYEIAVGVGKTIVIHEVSLSMVRTTTNSEIALQIKSPLLPEREITFVAHIPLDFSGLNMKFLAGIGTPSGNFSISASIQSTTEGFDLTLLSTSPSYRVLDDIKFTLSIKTPHANQHKADATLLAPFFFNGPCRLSGVIDKFSGGHMGYISFNLLVTGEIKTSWKMRVNNWDPATLQVEFETALSKNSFQVTIRKGSDMISAEVYIESPWLLNRSLKLRGELMREKLRVFRVNLAVEFNEDKFEFRSTYIWNSFRDFEIHLEFLTPWQEAYSTKFVGAFHQNFKELLVNFELVLNGEKKISSQNLFHRGRKSGYESTLSLNLPFSGFQDLKLFFRFVNDHTDTLIWKVGFSKDGDIYAIARSVYRTNYSSVSDTVLDIGNRKLELKTAFNRTSSGNSVDIQIFSHWKHVPDYSFAFLYDITKVPFALRTEIALPGIGRYSVNGSLTWNDWYNFNGWTEFGDVSGRKSDWTRTLQLSHHNDGQTATASLASTYKGQPELSIEWDNKMSAGGGKGRLQVTTPFTSLKSASVSYAHELSTENVATSNIRVNRNGEELVDITKTFDKDTHVIDFSNPISSVTATYTYTDSADGIIIRGRCTFNRRKSKPVTASFTAEIKYSHRKLDSVIIRVNTSTRDINLSLNKNLIKDGITWNLDIKLGPSAKDSYGLQVTQVFERGTYSTVYLARLPTRTIKTTISTSSYDGLFDVTIEYAYVTDKSKLLHFRLKKSYQESATGIIGRAEVIAQYPGYGKALGFEGFVKTSEGIVLEVNTEFSYGNEVAVYNVKMERPVEQYGRYYCDVKARMKSGTRGFILNSYIENNPNALELAIHNEVTQADVLQSHLVLTVDKIKREFDFECKYGRDVGKASGSISSDGIFGSLQIYEYSMSTVVRKLPSERKIVAEVQTDQNKRIIKIGLENDKEFLMEVTKETPVATESQLRVNIYLNQSRVLVTQINWKPEFFEESMLACEHGFTIFAKLISYVQTTQEDILSKYLHFGFAMFSELSEEMMEVAIYLRWEFPEVAGIVDCLIGKIENLIYNNVWYIKDILSMLDEIISGNSNILGLASQWASSVLQSWFEGIRKYCKDLFAQFPRYIFEFVRYTEKLVNRITRFLGQNLVSGAIKLAKYLLPMTFNSYKAAEEWILQSTFKASDIEELQLVKSIREIAIQAYGNATGAILQYVEDTLRSILGSTNFQNARHFIKVLSGYVYTVIDFMSSDANVQATLDRLVELGKNFAVHVLQTTAVRAIPVPKIEVYDPVQGKLLITQTLPLDWVSFTELPNLQEADFSKVASYYKQHLQDSVKDLYYSYRFDPDIKNWIPPFKKRALVAGGKNFLTFDGRSYNFDGDCTYLLARDFVDGNFTVIIKPDGNRKTIHVEFKDVSINFPPTEDIEAISGNPETRIWQSGKIIHVENKRGIKVMYDTKFDIFLMEISGWYQGKTGGLLGNYDNEYHNELHKSTGDPANLLEEFTSSWNVGTKCETKHTPKDLHLESHFGSKICAEIFTNSNSTLRPCFSKVDPMLFISMCMRDEGPSDTLAVCRAAAAYKLMCEVHNIPVQLPNHCRTCQYKSEIIHADETVYIPTNSNSTSLDIIYVVERGCHFGLEKINSLSNIVDWGFQTKYGGKDINYFVVGYGGKDSSAKVRLGKAIQYSRHDALEAINFAGTQFGRPTASKVIVLIPCRKCSSATPEYGQTLNTLLSQNIHLHVIVPNRSEIKLPDRVKSMTLLGFDKDSTLMRIPRDGKLVQGDADIRRQVIVPKDLCLTMSIETEGSVHRNFYFDKSTIDWFISKLAVDKPSCEKCKCSESTDGTLRTICEDCSPEDQIPTKQQASG